MPNVVEYATLYAPVLHTHDCFESYDTNDMKSSHQWGRRWTTAATGITYEEVDRMDKCL